MTFSNVNRTRRRQILLRSLLRLCGFFATVTSAATPSQAQRSHLPSPSNPNPPFGYWVTPPASDSEALPVYLAGKLHEPPGYKKVIEVMDTLTNVFKSRGLEVKEVGYFSNSLPFRHVRVQFDMFTFGTYRLSIYVHCSVDPSQFRNLKAVFRDSLQQTFKATAPELQLLGKFVKAQTKDVFNRRCPAAPVEAPVERRPSSEE